MKKGYVILLTILCIMIGFSLGYFFHDVNKNDVEVIQQSSSMEVYEEFASNTILEIRVETTNVNLQVIPSTNRNIRIVYRPSMEPSNFNYYIENKILFMHVDEVEKSGSIVPSDREMIYLYLPNNTDVTLRFTSQSGFLDISSTNVRNVIASTTSGIVSMSNVNVVLNANIETTTGKVLLKEISFGDLSVKTSSGLISCILNENIYYQHLIAKNGAIKVNDEDVGTLYTNELDSVKKMYLESRTGEIRVKVEETVYEE